MCIDAYQYNLYRRVQGRKARHLELLAYVLGLCIIGERSISLWAVGLSDTFTISSLIFIVD